MIDQLVLASIEKEEKINFETFDLLKCTRCGLCQTRQHVVPPKVVPNSRILFVGEAPGCFLPETPLFASDGYHDISEVLVSTKTLDSQAITNNLSYEVIDEPCMDVKIANLPNYKCTSSHEFLVTKRLKIYNKSKLPKFCATFAFESIGDICNNLDKFDYYVAIPKQLPQEDNDSIMLWFDKQIKHKKRVTDRKLPDSVELDEDLAFLFGFYAGDGCANFDAGTVTFCLGVKDRERGNLERLRSTIKKHFNLTPSVFSADNKIDVKVYSRTLCLWFKEQFGANVYVKDVPKFMFKASKKLVSSFIRGLFEADGSHNVELKRGQRICSVSKSLIYNVFYLCLKYNIFGTLQTWDSSKWTNRNEKRTYSIKFDTTAISRLGWGDIKVCSISSPHYGEDEKFFYLKIRGCNPFTYTGKVYDKTTEKHYYHIPFIVHNSDEDKYGTEPFIGRAGKLLDQCLENVGIVRREHSFINVINCNPPNNRKPSVDEIKACADILDYYIALINPEIIVCLGAVALKRIAGATGITKLNGVVIESKKYPNKKIIPVVHPSAALHDPRNIDYVVYGLQKVQAVLQGGVVYGKSSVTYVDTYEKFNLMMNDLESNPVFALDIEASSLRDWRNGEIICISFSNKSGSSYVLPWIVGDEGFYNVCRTQALVSTKRDVIETVDSFCSLYKLNKPNFFWKDTPNVKDRLSALLLNPNYVKVLHNYSYDYKFLQQNGLRIEGTIYDTMIMQYLLDEEANLGLDDLTLKYTNYGPYWKNLEKYIKKRMKDDARVYSYDTYAIIPINELAPYAGTDADVTITAFNILYPKLSAEGFLTLYLNFMLPLTKMLMETEQNGFSVDLPYIDELEKKLEKEIAEIDLKLVEYSKDVCANPKKPEEKGVNFNSGAQLGVFLYNYLRLPKVKHTAGGKPSTDEDVLTTLAPLHPVPNLILARKKRMKLLTTYVRGTRYTVWADGKVHPSFNITGTETGRLSASNPNLQNLPRKIEDLAKLGINVKDIYVTKTPETHCLVEVDYSQAELRLVAEYSRDRNLYSAFLHNRDPHAELAVRIYHRDRIEDMVSGRVRAIDIVTKEERQKGKTANFSLLYGKMPENFAEENGLSIEEATEIHRVYWETYSDIRNWMNMVLEQAYRTCEFSSFFGRKRRMQKLRSTEKWVRAEGERQGINFVIQSQASDYTLYSTMKVLGIVRSLGLDCKPVSFVHDSAVFEVSRSCLCQFLDILYSNMTTCIGVSIPMEIEVKVGVRYGSLKQWIKKDNFWVEKA